MNYLGITLGGVGLGLGLLAVTDLRVVSIGLFIVGVGLAGHLVAYMTLIQRRTPERLQGRVFSAAESLLTIPYALSMGLSVVLIAIIDYRLIYLVNAVVLLVVGAFLWRWTEDAPEAGDLVSSGRPIVAPSPTGRPPERPSTPGPGTRSPSPDAFTAE